MIRAQMILVTVIDSTSESIQVLMRINKKDTPIGVKKLIRDTSGSRFSS